MKDKVRRFKELIEKSPASSGRKSDELLAFKDELQEARSRGFTYLQIASFLKEVGLSVSKDTVRGFCMNVLNEQPVRQSPSHRRSARKVPSSNLESRNPVKVGDEAPNSKFASGKPHEAPNTGLKTSRRGPPAGFRVAGDEF